jgi:hypothetical protein
MIVANNLISPSHASEMRAIMLSQDFPWYYIEDALATGDLGSMWRRNAEKYNDEFYDVSVLRHTFIKSDGIENSGFIQMLDPVFVGIKRCIQRKFEYYNCAANLLPFKPGMENKRHYPHTDTYNEGFEGYTAILYLDNNGGATRVYQPDGSYGDYEPESGKLIMFDNSLDHSAPISGDNGDRVVINFNIKCL